MFIFTKLLSVKVSMSRIQTLYQDALSLIADWLNPWDLISMSRVSKQWYRLMRTVKYRKVISYPFKPKYKLTAEQFDCLKVMVTTKFNHPILVHGGVGSGKTWVAAAYFMHKFRQKIDLKEIAILVIVPPTLVHQWSEFFRIYTDLPVLSNYQSSCFYVKDWQKYVPRFSIFITSLLTSRTVQNRLIHDDRKHVIIHDESHNTASADLHSPNVIDIVGFTASMETFNKRSNTNITWNIVELKCTTLASTLPPVEFVCYEASGYLLVQKQGVANQLPQKGAIGSRDLNEIWKMLTFGTTARTAFHIKRGQKVLRHLKVLEDYYLQITSIENIESPEIINAKLISQMLLIPKLRQIAAVAEVVHNRGEKLIIFDTAQDLLLPLYLFLVHFGFNVCPFTTDYEPPARARMLEEFNTSGDILIGSIPMLSEGHNISCANNIIFLRYPDKPDEWMQALGRCHRYPQSKTVYIHMVVSCKLESDLAMRGFEYGYIKAGMKKYENELSDFKLRKKTVK